MKNITLPLVVRPSQREGLEMLAKLEGRSMSWFAREAIDDLLRKYGLVEKKQGDEATLPTPPCMENVSDIIAKS